jgi:hypothetical protein
MSLRAGALCCLSVAASLNNRSQRNTIETRRSRRWTRLWISMLSCGAPYAGGSGPLPLRGARDGVLSGLQGDVGCVLARPPAARWYLRRDGSRFRTAPAPSLPILLDTSSCWPFSLRRQAWCVLATGSWGSPSVEGPAQSPHSRWPIRSATVVGTSRPATGPRVAAGDPLNAAATRTSPYRPREDWVWGVDRGVLQVVFQCVGTRPT